MKVDTTIFLKTEIKAAWLQAVSVVSDYVKPIEKEGFTKTIDGKWSIAQNLDHLIRSTKPIVKALGAPKMGLRMFGKPNGPSRSYEVLLELYQNELENGAKAGGPFLPESEMNQTEMLEFWNSVGNRLAERLEKWSEKDLDKYVVKHPVLGKMTIREILFFTIFHTYHHLRAIKKIV